MDETKTDTIKPGKTLELELGDIINIDAPGNDEIHTKTFYIDYIDSNNIRLLDTNTLSLVYLNIMNNRITDETITSISILSKETEKGYARQNGLLPKTWIEMKIGGDVPVIIVAEITDLQEDMIELTTYPEKDVLYIDFAYKGIPLDIPIEQITIREAPLATLPPTKIGTPVISQVDEPAYSVSEIEGEDTKKSDIEESKEKQVTDPVSLPDEQEIILELPKEELAQQLQTILAESDTIIFGDMDKITQEVYVSQDEQRFSLEEQTTDLLDEMLSTIPNVERTNRVLSRIHLMIERFTQLRNMYSVHDSQNVVRGMMKKTAAYKPLVESLKHLQHNLYWLLPIVKNKKILCDVVDEGASEEVLLSLNDDIIPSYTSKVVMSMQEAINKYKEGQYTATNNYGAFMSEILGELNAYGAPDTTQIINNVTPHENVNVVLDNVLENLQDFYSSVSKKDKIRKQRFVIGKYNLGLQMLKADEMRGSYMKAHRIELTTPDTVPVNGFMTLPQSYVTLSKINLPGTTIYDRTNLNHSSIQYWKMLKKQTSVVKYNVNSLETSIDYSTRSFIDNIKAIVLSDEITNIADPVIKQRTYEKFLEVFIPTTQTLFSKYKEYIQNGLSIDSIIRSMEPFLIYRDDVTFKQYTTMQTFIEENLLTLKQQLIVNAKDTNTLRSLKTKMTFVNGILLALVGVKNAQIVNAYELNENGKNFNSDMYVKMMNTDYGNYYNTIIQELTRDLYVNIDIDQTLQDTISELEQRIQTQGGADTEDELCKTRELVKTYFTIEDLNDDDGTEEVYVDIKYDPTRYDFIEEYRKEQELLEKQEYSDFLQSKLREIVGMTEAQAKQEAQALIDGRRKIQNGNYAVLIQEETNEKNYYVRKNNAWVLDTTINASENVDDKTLFCNTSEKCLSLKDECVSIEDSKDKIMKDTVEKIAKSIADDEATYMDSLQTRLANYEDILAQLILLRMKMMLRTNNSLYVLGLDETGEGIVVSPYAELVDSILSQRDFSKKMLDINRFINAFTRNHNVESDESPYWYYCNKTNVKLLPTFYGRLSRAFIQEEDFLEVLDQICADQGVISDDGDKWVDKHSGYTIRMIELSTEEGFDEAGFTISTRAEIEELGERTLDAAPLSGDELYNTKEAIMIQNIINALGMYTGVEVNDKPTIIKGVLTHSMKQMGTKDKYEKMAKSAALKGKKVIPYEQKRNQYFLFFSGLYFLIFTQTSIPGVRTRKTFPGCVKSFSGFPLEDTGDTSGLKYIACIMKKISSSQSPWDAIKRISEASLLKNMEIIYTKILAADSTLLKRITDKRESIASGEEIDFIPDSINVANWTTFLPPLKPIKMSEPTNVSTDFRSKLMTEINKGSLKQIPMLSVIQSKIISFSLGIQNEIEKIVNKQDALLQSASSVPFLENMCCHNEIQKPTLQFFTDSSSKIITYNDIITTLRELYTNTITLSKSAMFSDIRDTKLKYPKVSDEFSEKTIYQGFIEFCKINKAEPIDDYMMAFCADRTSEFTKFDTLTDKIEILKKEGKVYNRDMFIEMLNIVNKQRVLTAQFDEVIPTSQEKLTYILTHLKSKIDAETANVSVSLVSLLENVLSIVGVYTTTMHSHTKNLMNFLITSTNMIKRNVSAYISEHSNFKRGEKKKITMFIDTIEQFETLKKTGFINKEETTDIRTIQFLQNCLYHMIHEYPNIILNKVNYSNISIHKYWKLSDKHNNDIKELVRKNYEQLKPFYGNEDLKPLLIEVQNLSRDIVDLMQNTPIMKTKQDGSRDVFHVQLVKHLYLFYFFSTLEKYIQLEELVMDEEYAVLKEDLVSSTIYADDEEDAETREKQQRMEMLEGNKVQVQKVLASLIGSYITIFNRQKERINMNRSTVLELVLRSKEREKNVKTRQLSDLTDEERKVDSELRKAKLGQWNIGLQKGLTQYVKDFYDVERDEMVAEAILESKVGNVSDVTNMNRDIYTMDEIEKQLTDLEAEKEAYDMSLFADDDDFGDRDGDEQY